MKQGDIILNLEDRLKVEYLGMVAGRVCSFKIVKEHGFEKFTGTYEELLKHCAKQVEAYNKHVEKFGGIYL